MFGYHDHYEKVNSVVFDITPVFLSKPRFHSFYLRLIETTEKMKAIENMQDEETANTGAAMNIAAAVEVHPEN